MPDRPNVLFACVHIAGPSVAYMTALSRARGRVLSAGSAPKSQINPVAVAAMAEEAVLESFQRRQPRD